MTRRLLLLVPLLVLCLAPPASAAPGWQWPLAGAPTVTRPFDPPDSPYGTGHRGVDLAGAPGLPVLAAHAGRVHYAGILAGRGVVSIDHPGGLRTTYEPLRPTVRAGQRVTAGDPIGSLTPGHPGCPAPACLHWGLRRGPDYLNPLSTLHPTAVRLLPFTAGTSPPTTTAAAATGAAGTAGVAGAAGTAGGSRPGRADQRAAAVPRPAAPTPPRPTRLPPPAMAAMGVLALAWALLLHRRPP
jgi:murein DD-endopeptidase MepM/ murein hydrolase activator NlpD